MTTFDEQTNNDLPGEVHDDFSWILPDGETIEDHIPNFYDENDAPDPDEDIEFKEDCDRLFQQTQDFGDAPDFDEESMGADGDFYDCEDDSWSDSDSLASCGWGEDEAYGCFE